MMKPTENTYGLAILNAGWAKDDDRWNFGPICSTFLRIYWVTRGAARVVIAGREHRLTPGHFYLIPPLTTHYDRSDGLFEHYYLHVIDNTRALEQIFEHYELPFEVKAEQAYTTFFSDVAHRYPELRLPHPEPVSYETNHSLISSAKRFAQYPMSARCEMNGMVLLLLSLFLRQARERARVTDDRIDRTLRHIDQHIDRPLTISELASRASLSKEQFIRLFHRQMGTTPTTYIIGRKVLRAQMLFAAGNHSVKRVALLVGYDNLSYFARVFRQHVGMSPSDFIRQNKME